MQLDTQRSGHHVVRMSKVLIATVAALGLAACTDAAELPDAFHVVEVPGTVVATVDGDPCDLIIADGSHFYIVGGPDSYSLSLTTDPSQFPCSWDPPTMTCEYTYTTTMFIKTITLNIDGDRAHVEAIGAAPGTAPSCQMSMDATIEPL